MRLTIRRRLILGLVAIESGFPLDMGGDTARAEDPGLLARLARRVLIQVTALPSVRLEARTGRFTAP